MSIWAIFCVFPMGAAYYPTVGAAYYPTVTLKNGFYVEAGGHASWHTAQGHASARGA